jgi:hypothetical protein
VALALSQWDDSFCVPDLSGVPRPHASLYSQTFSPIYMRLCIVCHLLCISNLSLGVRMHVVCKCESVCV